MHGVDPRNNQYQINTLLSQSYERLNFYNGKKFWFTNELSYLQYGEDTQKLYCE